MRDELFKRLVNIGLKVSSVDEPENKLKPIYKCRHTHLVIIPAQQSKAASINILDAMGIMFFSDSVLLSSLIGKNSFIMNSLP